MLSEIEVSYCIDTERVFAAGGSWGGDVVIALACHRGDKLRAVEVNSSGDEYTECFFDSAIGHSVPPNLTRDTWSFFSAFERQHGGLRAICRSRKSCCRAALIALP
jgi:pimeloyl-ACP methyl ester carboxylesterase